MTFIHKLINKLFGKSSGAGSETERPALDRLENNHGYYALPGTRQYGAGPAGRVDKANWKPCESCGRSIPMVADSLITEDGRLAYV